MAYHFGKLKFSAWEAPRNTSREREESHDESGCYSTDGRFSARGCKVTGWGSYDAYKLVLSY